MYQAQRSIIDRQALLFLTAGVVLLAILNSANYLAGMPFWTVTQFIDLGSDNSVAAWYSSILLALGTFLALECFAIAKREQIPSRKSLLLFAGLLGFMSCDEIARFHEILGGLGAKYMGIHGEFAQHANWVWVLGPVVLALFYLCFAALRKVLLLAPGSLLWLGLGFGLIVLGGVILESSINWLNHQELQSIWNAEIVVEESLEMLGTISICYSLLIWRDGMSESAIAMSGSG